MAVADNLIGTNKTIHSTKNNPFIVFNLSMRDFLFAYLFYSIYLCTFSGVGEVGRGGEEGAERFLAVF